MCLFRTVFSMNVFPQNSQMNGLSLSVTHKVTFVVKGVSADLAAMGGSQNCFSASAPDGRLVVRLMAPDVLPQLAALCKCFPANFAAERHLSVVGLHVSLQRASMQICEPTGT
uniref:Uncharacterized protein n=1 Tax=Scophthalmus maximus TaxID=52904 RepID=A0A8D3CSN9_SCOMX